MKKMKGAAVGVGGDIKARLKHQSLLHDYKYLLKETESKRKRLLHVKDKKLTLLAEVQFLRQRYEFLLKTRSLSSNLKRDIVLPQTFERSLKKTRSLSSNLKRDIVLPQTFERSLKKASKGKKSVNLKPAIPRPHTHPVRFNRKGGVFNLKEAMVQKPVLICDLNEIERVNSGKESTSRKLIPAIDLNQTAKEEEDFQASCEVMKSEDPKKILLTSPFSEQQNDLKLSVCRNNGSNVSSKRNISWQDQMALRV